MGAFEFRGAQKGLEGHGRAWKDMEGLSRAQKGSEGNGRAYMGKEGQMEGREVPWRDTQGYGWRWDVKGH